MNDERRREELATDPLSLRGHTLAAVGSARGPLDNVSTMLDWQCAFGVSVLQAQAEALTHWTLLQKATVSVQQDIWDGLACRFGGGVPLDG